MNPIVDAATSGNDFDLRDLRKKRMSIYVGVTPNNLERMQPILNLFFQQLIDLNTRELPIQNKSLKYTCLLLMDEFTALGKINILSKGIGYIAGYGLRMMPIIQSNSQIAEVYGKEAATTFTINHAMNIVFPPKASDLQATRDISEWLGYTTVKGVSESRSKNVFSKRDKTQNTSDQRRALLLPQEVAALGQDTAIIVMENTRPIKAKKAAYYSDETFLSRLREVSPMFQQSKAKALKEDLLAQLMAHQELSAPVPLLQLDQASIAPATATPQPNGLPTMNFDLPDIAPPASAEGYSLAELHAWADELTKRAGY